jgi:hypothetical protein
MATKAAARSFCAADALVTEARMAASEPRRSLCRAASRLASRQVVTLAISTTASPTEARTSVISLERTLLRDRPLSMPETTETPRPPARRESRGYGALMTADLIDISTSQPRCP